MTAGTLQRWFLVSLCAVAVVMAVGTRSWWPIPTVIAIALVGYASAIALEFAWLSRHHGESTAPTAAQLVRAWAIEVAHGPRVFGWLQPFRHRAIPDLDAPARAGVRGVVLVHGFFCNRAIWSTWMRRFRREAIPYVAVDLRPVFGSIEGYADAIDGAVRRMAAAAGGRAPIVVAHSMGGVAVRAWCARTGADADAAVQRIVTIGTPHRGTWLARFARAANGREMRTDSDLLASLAASESPSLRSRFVCYWSDCDNIVFPSRNATLDGADNRAISGWAHVHLIEHPDIVAAVLAAARAPDQMS